VSEISDGRTKRIAIMQPYFFPYQGYFNLLSAVDAFVLLDDVQFVRRSWINRNRLIDQSGVEWTFTIPVSKASQEARISEMLISEVFDSKSLCRRIESNYRSKPNFDDGYDLLIKAISQGDFNPSLLSFLKHSLVLLMDYLKIDTKILLSSEIDPDSKFKSSERIIHICKQLNATEYLNLPGGVNLYDHSEFRNSNLKLSFIQPSLRIYDQASEFIPGLSILDMIFSIPRVDAINRIRNDFQIL
jgi:hypothetical protein